MSYFNFKSKIISEHAHHVLWLCVFAFFIFTGWGAFLALLIFHFILLAGLAGVGAVDKKKKSKDSAYEDILDYDEEKK